MTLLGHSFEIQQIFTGLSVIVSALGIIANQFFDRYKRYRVVRAQALDSATRSLLDVLEQMIQVREHIGWADATGDSLPS
jgi:hypothetical protein